jgi:hypothetical protein
VRPLSDRPSPPIAAAGLRPAGPVVPYGARVYGAPSRGRLTTSPDADPGRAPLVDDGRTLLAARPAAPGVEAEVSIRMYADGGSISVVRHLRDGMTVGIEALIR